MGKKNRWGLAPETFRKLYFQSLCLRTLEKKKYVASLLTMWLVLGRKCWEYFFAETGRKLSRNLLQERGDSEVARSACVSATGQMDGSLLYPDAPPRQAGLALGRIPPPGQGQAKVFIPSRNCEGQLLMQKTPQHLYPGMSYMVKRLAT